MSKKTKRTNNKQKKIQNNIDKNIVNEIKEEIEKENLANESKKEVVDDLSTLKDDFFANLDRETKVEDAIQNFRKKSRDKVSGSQKGKRANKKNSIKIPFLQEISDKTGFNISVVLCGFIVPVLFVFLIVALIFDRGNMVSDVKNVTTASQLKQTANKEISKLVGDYFNALSECDIKALSKVMDSVGTLTEDELRKKGEYIEGYENIKIYTKKGVVDNEYVVYVYYENKILNINTLAPGSKVLYVKRNDKNNGYIIHNGIKDTDIAKRIEELSKDKDIKKFNKEVNDKLMAACKKDEDLKNFYNALMSAGTPETTKEGETTAQETTVAQESGKVEETTQAAVQ